jgi:hypothetical protein
MKNFTPEQLQGFKEDLAECCMETSEITSETTRQRFWNHFGLLKR